MVIISYNCTKFFQNLLENTPSLCEARQLIGVARKQRVKYQNMKAETLRQLQKLLDEVKWIDRKILEVDTQIDQVFDKSGFGIPPSTRHRVVIEGCE